MLGWAQLDNDPEYSRVYAQRQHACLGCAVAAAPTAFCYSRNGRFGIFGDHCSLMLAVRITLLHFSVSAMTNASKSAGEPETIVVPRSARRDVTWVSARLALISLLSWSTIPAGVLLRTPMAHHVFAS